MVGRWGERVPEPALWASHVLLGENTAIHTWATGRNERAKDELLTRGAPDADVCLAVDRLEVGENVLSAAEKG